MLRILLMVFRNFWKVPAAWFKLCHYAKHTDKYSYEEKYKHLRYIMKMAVTSGNIDLQVYGKENIPEESGMLLCGNHQGMFDILAIVESFEKPLAAVLKKELADIPFLKQVIACTKSFPMDREDIRKSMKVIQDVTKEIMAGRNFLIFPEGTRNKKADEIDLLPLKGGANLIAFKTNSKIVPVGMAKKYKVFRKNYMYVGEPYDYSSLKGQKLSAELSDELTDDMKNRLLDCIKNAREFSKESKK